MFYTHFFTGPIDAVLFQSTNYHILRPSTVSGSCRAIGTLTNSAVLEAGSKRIQFSVQDCPGFAGFVYDAYTGFNSVSRILIEELMPRENMYTSVIIIDLNTVKGKIIAKGSYFVYCDKDFLEYGIIISYL